MLELSLQFVGILTEQTYNKVSDTQEVNISLVVHYSRCYSYYF